MVRFLNLFLTDQSFLGGYEWSTQDIAGPLYPQTHASFVGEGRSYKPSVNSAQSKHVKGVNEPQNWRLPQTIYFWISAVRATFWALMLFLTGSNYARLLCVAPTYNESVSSTWSKQFKVGSFFFPRRFIIFVGDRFNVKMGPYQRCVGWCTQLAIVFQSYRSCQQPKRDFSTGKAWTKKCRCQNSASAATTCRGKLWFSAPF